MAKIFSEDAYCLGLLYSYLFAGKKMVLKDDLDAFYNTIEKNLENTDAFDLYATVWHDDPCIYYPSEGKNGEVYYVLYSNFDVERAESKYIGCLSTQVLLATQKENALNCLGLQMKNGHISKKSNYHIGIVSAPTFMSQFISKLKSGELKIETCPQVEIGSELTKEYIVKQLESYQKLLESGIIDAATEERIIYASCGNGNPENWVPELVDKVSDMLDELKEEQGPVKKLVPNNKK